MTAFVPAASAGLSQRSSFTPTSSSLTSIRSHKSRHLPVVPKSSSTVLIRMNADEEDEPRHAAAVEYDQTKLFVGNLAWATTDESLKEAFSKYGEVVDVRVITDRFTGRSRGFGFVEYDAAADANEALEEMNGADIDGRNVRVDRATSRERPQFRRRRDDFY